MANNVINAVFSSSTITYTKPAYQYDYGMILKFSGIELPQAYEVHFSNTEFCGESISQIGDESGVTIPDEMFLSGAPIYAWTFLHTGEDDGETVYKTVISINKRAQPSNIEPTPVQQDVIAQAIAALNVAVEQTAQDVIDATAAKEAAETAQGLAESARDAAETAQGKAEDAQEGAETAQGKAEDAQRSAEQAAGSVLGLTADATVDANVGTPSVEVEVTTESDHKKMSFAFHNLKGVKGDPGDTGVGISSVVLNADYTLTITLTNGVSYTTTSIRGEVGATPNLTIGTVSTLPEGSQATATITGTDEDPVLNLGIPVGDTGATGNSIASIAKTGTVGLVDTYTITYTNGTTSTFEVTNGADGEVSEEELTEKLADKADVITSSASGEIVTIADGGDNLPVKKLAVSLLPVQDLHGQDAPYPPGGGENKANLTTATVRNDGTYGLYVTIDQNEETITMTGTWTAGAVQSWRFLNTPDIDTSLNIKFFELTSGSHIASILQDGTEHRLVIQVVGMTNGESYTIKFKLCAYSGTAPTSWTPYSNICPISGWTGVTVSEKYKNLMGGITVANRIKDLFGANATLDTTNKTIAFQPTSAQGYKALLYNMKGYSATIPFPCSYPFKENTRYTIIFKANTNSFGSFNIGVSYDDGTSIGLTTANRDANGYIVFVTSASKNVRSIYVGIYAGQTTLYYETFGIFEGVLTSKDFVPYEGSEKYEVDWTDEAGTVYGCNLSLTSGLLTVNYKYYTNSGTGNWGEVSTNGSRYYIGGVSSDAVNADTTGVCNLGLLVSDYYQDGIQVSSNGRINLCGSFDQ